MTGSGESSSTEVQGTSDAEQALLRLVATQRMYALYPARNPKVLTALASFREALAPFSATRPLEFEVGRDHMLHGDLPILPNQNEVRDLARKLYLASVVMVSFLPEATEDELLNLFALLRLTDEQRREIGSIADELRRRGVSHIQVREAGRVTIEEAGAGGSDPWNLASLEELEALEMAVLGDGRAGGFHQSFRVATEGQDPKAGRLLGLISRPGDFATLLLDTASQHRVDGKVELDRQLAFVIDLVARLDPMIQPLPPADATRLYRDLGEVVATLERSIHRELLETAVPPYVRLGAVERLFPEQIRPLNVKEALGLGLGPGLMPLLMGSLRRMAVGAQNLSDFLAGVEEPEVESGEYRPALLPPAPPAPPPLLATFYEPFPGGAAHPGEAALASAIAVSRSSFDSIATLLDVLAAETDLAAFQKLLDQLVTRFTRCLATGGFSYANQIVNGLTADWRRRHETHGEAAADFTIALARAYDLLGSPEAMRAFLDATVALAPGPALERAAAPLLSLPAAAVTSLLGLLGEEVDASRRARLLDILALVGPVHVDLVTTALGDPQAQVVQGVVTLLGRWGAEMVPRVLPAVQHPDPAVKKEVIQFLGQYRTAESIQGLGRLVHDADDAVTREAIKRLVELCDPSCLLDLHDEIRSPRLGTRHPATIAALTRALGSIGDASSRKVLAAVVAERGTEPWLASSRLRKLFDEAQAAITARIGKTGA